MSLLVGLLYCASESVRLSLLEALPPFVKGPEMAWCLSCSVSLTVPLGLCGPGCRRFCTSVMKEVGDGLKPLLVGLFQRVSEPVRLSLLEVLRLCHERNRRWL